MKGTKRKYGHGKYEEYRTQEQLFRLYEYNKFRFGDAKAKGKPKCTTYRIRPEDVDKLMAKAITIPTIIEKPSPEHDSGQFLCAGPTLKGCTSKLRPGKTRKAIPQKDRRELVESLAGQFAGQDSKLLFWYHVAFGIAVARIPARDVEDVAQEIVLALQKQESKYGMVGEGLARIIAKRIVFAYYDQHRARRIENRSYANLLLAKPGKVNLSPEATLIFPKSYSARTQEYMAEMVEIRDNVLEPIAVDANFDVAEDKAEVGRILESLPPAMLPTVLTWLDPTRRQAMGDKERQAISRLTRKLRIALAV